MSKKKRSREEFEAYLHEILEQDYPDVYTPNLDSAYQSLIRATQNVDKCTDKSRVLIGKKIGKTADNVYKAIGKDKPNYSNLRKEISNLIGDVRVVERSYESSIKELEELTGKKINDLHKHLIDPITFSCKKCDGTMNRIEEVLDCWFESGAMPYAQNHYPFENKKKFENT